MTRASLVVQWLRFCASNAGGVGSIPGWETKIPHVARYGQKKIKRMTKANQAKVAFGLERGQDPSQLHLRMKTLSAEGTSQSIVVVKARVSLQTGERTCPAKAQEEAEERRPS